jgi:tetratricopeptide (TPR) repeat protein
MRGGGLVRRPRPFARLALAAAAATWLASPFLALSAPPSAESLLEGGRAREAAAAAGKRLDADPSDGAARLLRARARIALRDLPGAQADVDEALRRAPGWPQALAVRSLVLLAGGRTREAVGAARTAAAAGPREKWAAYALGRTLLASGDAKGGLAAFESATRLDPAWVAATIERGKVRERLGDREGALADYERALLLEPASRVALDARDGIRGGRPDAIAGQPDTASGKPSAALAAAPRDTAIRPPRATLPASAGGIAGSGAATQAGTATTPVRETPPVGAATAAGPAPPSGAVTAAAPTPLPGVATAAEPTPTASPAPFVPGALPPELRLLAFDGPPPPANVPPFLDLRDLSAATWGGAVSAAKETMRLVIGSMTSEEQKGFDDTWTPLFRFPHEKLVDWLNALNPLLGQYLATRASAAEAVLGFDAAQLEAAAAAGAGDAAVVAEAMQSAGLARPLVVSLAARLEETVREIEALGPPPDPDEEQKRRKAKHEAAFRLLEDFPLEGEWVGPGGGVTQIKLLKRYPDGRVLFWEGPKTALEAAAAAGIDTSKPGMGYSEEKKGMFIVPGIYDLMVAAEPLPDGRFAALNWVLCPGARVYRVDGDSVEVTTFVVQCLARNEIDSSSGRLTRRPLRGDPVVPPGKTWAEVVALAETSGRAKLEQLEKSKGLQGELWAAVASGRAPEPTRAAEGAAPSAPPPPPTPAAKSPEEEQLEKDKVAFHETNVQYFESQVAAAERDVAGAKDTASREELSRRLLYAKDALQRERDAITTIRTGEFTRTRTEADALNLMIMEKQGRDQAAYWSEVQRVMDHVPRLIAMAPESERERLTDFFQKQVSREAIASGDLGRIRRAASSIGTKVHAGLESDAANAEMEAVDASQRLAYVESVKKTCDTSLLVLSGFGGTGIATAYMGVTGYMQGGPTEAFKQAATTWSIAARVASETMDAYQAGVVENYEAYARDPGKVKIEEEKAGFTAAAWSAGQTAAFAGLMKVGSLALGRVVGGVRKAGGPPGGKVSFRDVVAEARFRQDQEGGRALVGAFRDKATQLAAAGRAGASRAEIARLRGEAEGLYRSIKTDFHAKVELNALARAGESKLVHAFNSFDRPAMARLKERVSQRMQADGWSSQEYKTFSNSASKGKVGMDVDLGAVEPPRYVLSGGKQVPNPEHLLWQQTLTQRTPGGLTVTRSPHEFQEAGQRHLNDAFREVYGRPPGQAFTNFTTSYHPEAYRDVSWLGNFYTPHAIKGRVDRRWVQQAADVTGFKVSSLPREHPALGRYATLQEQCRGMVKDIDTKLKPFLRDATNKDAVKHLGDLRDVMERFARNEIGPIEAERRLNLMTGGEGIVGVQDRFRVMLQGLAGKVK